MNPWSASFGVQKKTREKPTTSIATVSAGRILGARKLMRRLVLEHEVVDRIAHEAEHDIVESEDRHPLAETVVRRAACGEQPVGCAGGADHHRNEQWEQEERGDQVPRP